MVRGSGRMPIGRFAVALAAESEEAGHTNVWLEADSAIESQSSKMALLKDDLLALCELAGIEASDRLTKREIVALLDAAN